MSLKKKSKAFLLLLFPSVGLGSYSDGKKEPLELTCLSNTYGDFSICHLTGDPQKKYAYTIVDETLTTPDGHKYTLPEDSIISISEYLNNNDIPKEDLMVMMGTEQEGGENKKNR